MNKNEFVTSPAYQGWEMRAVKTGIGHDLAGWQGTLYKDGNKVAIVDDDGYGGQINVYWEYHGRLKRYPGAEEQWKLFLVEEEKLREKNPDLWDEFEKQQGHLIFDGEIMLSDLMHRALEFKETKRLCKNKVIIQTEDTIGTNSYNHIPIAFASRGWDRVKAELKQAWKKEKIVIINELLENKAGCASC